MSVELQTAQTTSFRREGVQVRAWLPFLAVGGTAAICAVRLFRLTDRYAVNILFRDQWKFDDATLFEQHSLLEIFRWQHGPHRQGLGGVLSKLLEPLIRWNSRYEAFGIVGVLVISALLALWLKRRLLGEIDYADVIVPLILLTPVQYQVIFEGPNPSHGPIPVLLLMIYGLAWTIKDERVRWVLVLAVNLLLIYTGFGLLMGIVTPFLLAYEYFRTRNRTALLVLATALFSFGSFFIGYKFNAAADCFSPNPANPFHYLLFAGFMLSSFVGVQPVSHLLAAVILGLFLLGGSFWVLCGTAVRLWREGTANSIVPLALLAYSLLFLLGTAYGRICLGLAAAQASRYTCYTAAGFFAVYLTARSLRSSALLAAVCVFGLMTTFGLSRWDKTQIAQVSEGRRKWKDCYLLYHDVARCDQESNSTIYWMPEPPDLQPKLRMLQSGRLNLYSDGLEQ